MTEMELPKGKNKKIKLSEFIDHLKEIDQQVGMPMSARGWGYTLEGDGLITKAQIDLVENLINECRKSGLLPIDFTAQEEARQFTGIEIPTEETPIGFMRDYMRAVLDFEPLRG